MNNFNDKNNLLTKERNHEFDLFDPFGDLFMFPHFEREHTISNLMKTDIAEKENGFELLMDMPGVDKKDIAIDLNNGYLTISASRKEVKNENEKNRFIRKERYYGSVSRSFYVGDIKEDDISAKLENGILNVSFPKENKKEEKKHIEIQ